MRPSIGTQLGSEASPSWDSQEATVSEERKPECDGPEDPTPREGGGLGRREALRKIARLAAWTAPTVTVLKSIEAKATPGSFQPPLD